MASQPGCYFCTVSQALLVVCALKVFIILIVVKCSRRCALNVTYADAAQIPFLSLLLLLISITCCWIICGCPGWAMEPCWEAMADWPGGTIMIPCVDMATLPGPTILWWVMGPPRTAIINNTWSRTSMHKTTANTNCGKNNTITNAPEKL